MATILKVRLATATTWLIKRSKKRTIFPNVYCEILLSLWLWKEQNVSFIANIFLQNLNMKTVHHTIYAGTGTCNSVTPYWGSGLAKTTWRPCWRDRLTVCPEGDLVDWLLGQKWGHEWDDTLSWYLGKLISSFDKRLFSFQLYIWYLYKNRPICIWGIIL